MSIPACFTPFLPAQTCAFSFGHLFTRRLKKKRMENDVRVFKFCPVVTKMMRSKDPILKSLAFQNVNVSQENRKTASKSLLI